MAILHLAIVLVSLAALIAGIPADLSKSDNMKMAAQPQISNQGQLLYEELEYIYNAKRGSGNVTGPKTLTPCARAILGCCQDGQMQESCSEELGCGPYFFDDNPCDEKFVIDALIAARSFYGQFVGKVNT